MTLFHFAEGIDILARYFDEDGHDVGADHDTVYVYPTDRPVDTHDLPRLVELGWFQPDVDVGDGEFQPEHYDPKAGWQAYV